MIRLTATRGLSEFNSTARDLFVGWLVCCMFCGVPSAYCGNECRLYWARYALKQRVALGRFLEDGRLEADNNRAENAIRPLSLGRKNWLFAGSERGGQATALYLGLLQSCKACEVNPWSYFDDVLRRIQAHPVRQLRELLPDQWRPLPRERRGLILPA